MIKIAKKKKNYHFFQAKERHESRTKRSRKSDESRTAKKTTQKITEGWMKNPAGSDIVGIDTKKHKAKNMSEPSQWLISSFKKVGRDKQLKKKDFIFTLDNRRAILTVSPRGHKATTKKTLQALLDIRYNNVQVRSRKKKGRPDDFWISVLKK